MCIITLCNKTKAKCRNSVGKTKCTPCIRRDLEVKYQPDADNQMQLIHLSSESMTTSIDSFRCVITQFNYILFL